MNLEYQGVFFTIGTCDTKKMELMDCSINHPYPIIYHIDSKFEKAYLYCGAAEAQKNKQSAIKDFDEAIKLDPNDVEVYLARALIRSSLRDYKGALKDIKIINKISPKNPAGYYIQGILKNKLGNKSGALEDLKKASLLGYKKADNEIKKIQSN